MLFFLWVFLLFLILITTFVIILWSVFLFIKLVITKSVEKKNKIRKRTHKSMIIMDIFITILTIVMVYWNQSRSFYCLSEERCVTVWKRIGGYCYIIPGKYYGIFEPKDNYVKTDNLVESLTIIFTNDNRLVIYILPIYYSKFVSDYSDKGLKMIEDYQSNKTINDSIYTYFNGEYNVYKDNVNFICLYIKENRVLK